ncbi:MAG TPA: metallophosphoesterase family protein [Planctomycetaceae bacterium]|nr:metallophosphoesterase family protein [Planctomycetaceae bacterium]
MKIGIISDTHDRLLRTRFAVQLLKSQGAELLVHCGDFIGSEILIECSVLPLYFVFGNNDCDTVPYLRQTATDLGATCLGWGGEFTVQQTRLAVVHGHLTSDLRPLLKSQPQYLFSGHSHNRGDWHEGPTRRINPGALHRAEEFTVALLDLDTNALKFLPIPKQV